MVEFKLPKASAFSAAGLFDAFFCGYKGAKTVLCHFLQQYCTGSKTELNSSSHSIPVINGGAF